jgi:hypothetical protein
VTINGTSIAISLSSSSDTVADQLASTISAINALLEKSPLRKENFGFYELEDFYPLVTFLGCGLGYHIEEMVLEHNVHNVLVVEPSLDKFAASLYAVDWRAICQRYIRQDGKCIHFIIGAERNEYLIWAVTWNRLIELSPHFPVAALFYNHQGDELFDNVSDRVNKDLMVFLLSWGHYDDELRQMNYALHNFHQGVKMLPPKMAQQSDTPVFVVGAGPSLDGRIEHIKKVRDKVILISCGTALKTLNIYGVKPDIHVELESDIMAYISLTQAADSDYFKSIKEVGPSHISPLIYKLFGDGRMYFKSESATANLFGKDGGHIIVNGTPTCTNLGVALAVNMGFNNVFLFGLDFGFKDKNRHHAKGSIYYEKILKLEHEDKDLVQIEAVDGEIAWSTPNYFTSKRKVENLIQSFSASDTQNFYNCSDVAVIEGAEWLEGDQFINRVDSLDGQKQADMEYIFSDDAQVKDLSKIDGKLRYIEHSLMELHRDLDKLLLPEICNMEDMTIRCSKINWYLEEILKPSTPDFYYFVRGAVRHYLCVGFAHAFAIRDTSARMQFIADWKAAFSACFRDKPDHFRSVVYKEFDIDTDIWVKQSSIEAEDEINPFFTKSVDELEYPQY